MRSRLMSRIALATALVLVLAPIQPAFAATGAWDDPVTVGSGVGDTAELVADGSTLITTRLLGAAPLTEVVASRSSNGVTWSPLAFLSAQGVIDAAPQLVSAGGLITTAWVLDGRAQAASSTNGGATWSAAATLSPAGESVSQLHLASDGDMVVATWLSEQGGDYRIRVATSVNGTSWAASQQLAIGEFVSSPNAVVSGTTAAVAWADFDDGNFFIRTSASTTSGSSWSAPVTLPSVGGQRPQLALDGTRLTAVIPNLEGALIARSSPDLGQTWPDFSVISLGLEGEAIRLDVVAEGENISAIWLGALNSGVQASSSFDGGLTWTAPELLSTEPAPLSTPQLALYGDARAAVWVQVDGVNVRALVSTSADGGVNWTDRVTLSESGGDATRTRVVIRGRTTTALWGLTVGGAATVQASSFTEPLDVSRLAGSNRYETSVAIAGRFNPGVPVVYLATGTNYPDALSAASAAGSQGGPLLLTMPNSVPGVVADELERLDPELVVIVGGTGAVSNRVLNTVRSLLPAATVRRDSGSDRYATSRVIADRAFSSAETAFIATGTNFPDALSASAAGGALGAPVVLVNGASSSLDAATLELLDDLGVTSVTIVGGTGAVSRGIEDDLDDAFGAAQVQRRSGSDRYATSVAVNAEAFDDADTVFLATGLGFADALAGAALAGRVGGPLYVVPGTCVPQSVLDEIERLRPLKVVLFGGTGVLSSRVASLTAC